MNGEILPGAALGVLGSGQLGRMFALTARRMGYRVHVFSPQSGSPAGQVADRELIGRYDDPQALRAFACDVSAITVESETIPSAALDVLAEHRPVRPSSRVLHITQHRLREKAFLRQAGFPVAPFHRVTTAQDLQAALTAIPPPTLLKTATFGYDGKGQAAIATADEGAAAFSALGGQDAILEARLDLACELSVVAVRGVDGRQIAYEPLHNTHRGGILDASVAPAGLDPTVARRAVEIAHALLDELNVVGVLCSEFFLTRAGALIVNELAPRPHNSGHLTIEACAASQFEQQVRAVCGLPLGATTLLCPAAMVNLLGDLWQDREPNWPAALCVPDVTLHLYGKREALPGRKMGHMTALASDPQTAMQRAHAARSALLSQPSRYC